MALASAVLLAPTVAHAQRSAKESGVYNVHPSVVMESVTELNPPATTPVSQQQVADAVLASALRDVYDRTDPHGHKGEFNHCIALNRILVQGDPRNLDAYATTAYLLWSTDRIGDGIAFLKTGLKQNEDNFYMWDEVGAAYSIYQKDPASAIPYYEKAVSFPCPYSTWHALANCYERTKQWKKAVDTWRAVGTKFPNDPLAHQKIKRAEDRLKASGA
jgi:tetratricopeptide (TPR) repeat protein